MKAYIKPIIKTANIQADSQLLVGSLVNRPGDGEQLIKGMQDFYPFIESTDDVEEQ